MDEVKQVYDTKKGKYFDIKDAQARASLSLIYPRLEQLERSGAVIVIDYWNTTPSNPSEGQYRYDTPNLYRYDGSNWIAVQPSEKVIYVNNQEPQFPALYKYNDGAFVLLTTNTADAADEVPGDAVEITGRKSGDPSDTKLYIQQSDFEAGKSYVIHNDVWMTDDIVIPTGTKLYVDGTINGTIISYVEMVSNQEVTRYRSTVLTGQSTKFNGPFKTIFRESTTEVVTDASTNPPATTEVNTTVTVAGTWDCMAKPDWFGAKSDTENFGKWPLVFYMGDLEQPPTLAVDGQGNLSTLAKSVKFPNAYIDERLVVEASESYYGEKRSRDVYYDSMNKRFVIKDGNSYYASWNNSDEWNDSTGKARLDTLFFSIEAVESSWTNLGERGTTGNRDLRTLTNNNIDAFHFVPVDGAYTKVGWSEGLVNSRPAFVSAKNMTGGKLQLAKCGTYYLDHPNFYENGARKNFMDGGLAKNLLPFDGLKEIVLDGNDANLLAAPAPPCYSNAIPGRGTHDPAKVIHIQNSGTADLRNVSIYSVADKMGIAYGEDYLFTGGGYRAANLCKSNTAGIRINSCEKVRMENFNVYGMDGLLVGTTSHFVIELVAKRCNFIDNINAIFVTSLGQNLIFEDCNIITKKANDTGGHALYHSLGGDPSSNNATFGSKILFRDCILKAGDESTNCLVWNNSSNSLLRSSDTYEGCLLEGNKLIQSASGASVFRNSILKRTMANALNDNGKSLFAPQTFTLCTDLFFYESQVHSIAYDMNRTPGLAPAISLPESTSAGRNRVFFARNSKFWSDAVRPIVVHGSVDVANCTFYGTNATTFITVEEKNNPAVTEHSDHRVYIRNSRFRIGQKMIKTNAECIIEDNNIGFNTADHCILVDTDNVSLKNSVIRHNVISMASGATADISNIASGGVVYDNVVFGNDSATNGLYKQEVTLNDIRDMIAPKQANFEGTLIDRWKATPLEANKSIYHDTTNDKYYKCTNVGAKGKFWFTVDAAEINTAITAISGTITIMAKNPTDSNVDVAVAEIEFDSAADGVTFSSTPSIIDVREYIYSKCSKYGRDNHTEGTYGSKRFMALIPGVCISPTNYSVIGDINITSATETNSVNINKNTQYTSSGANPTWEEIGAEDLAGIVDQVAWLMEQVKQLIGS